MPSSSRSLLRGAAAGPLLALLVALAGCSSPADHASDERATTVASHPEAPGAGTSRAVDDHVTKLLVFVVENHSLDQMRRGMPFVRGLADRYGYATRYRAVTHPSLPNYLAIAGGDTFGVTDDAAPSVHPLPGPTVFGSAISAGSTAKLYAEAMDTRCQLEPSGRYAVKHNPWAYFTDERALCQRHDVPLRRLGTDVDAGRLPAVGMVIPDLCNDAHDCTLARADGWLKKRVGRVMGGPDWASGHLAIVITADEDDRQHGNLVLTVVAHPAVDHAVVTTRLTHYALSRSYSQVSGADPIGHAADARSLLRQFGLRPGA
jgi:acid phosphatase